MYTVIKQAANQNQFCEQTELSQIQIKGLTCVSGGCSTLGSRTLHPVIAEEPETQQTLSRALLLFADTGVPGGVEISTCCAHILSSPVIPERLTYQVPQLLKLPSITVQSTVDRQRRRWMAPPCLSESPPQPTHVLPTVPTQ